MDKLSMAGEGAEIEGSVDGQLQIDGQIWKGEKTDNKLMDKWKKKN